MNKIYQEKSLQKLYIALISIVVFINFLYSNKVIELNDKYLRVLNTMGMIALVLIMDRDYFLPFLGDTVFPSGLLSDTAPKGASKSVCVYVKPNTKVVYWASEQNEDSDVMPWTAYKKYTNSGVTTSDANGKACLSVRMPSGYKTPFGEKLKPHVHYRCALSGGMFSSIQTKFIT
jgi:hypothetical protein